MLLKSCVLSFAYSAHTSGQTNRDDRIILRLCQG